MDYYDSKATGLRISQLRKARGLTQNDLAECIDISEKHIGRIERGESDTSPHTYAALSKFFNVSLDYLFFGEAEDLPISIAGHILQNNPEKMRELMLNILTLLDGYQV